MSFMASRQSPKKRRDAAKGHRWLQSAAGLVLLLLFLLARRQAVGQTPAQPALPEGTPLAWAREAAKNEVAIVESEGRIPMRYRQRKIDAKGDTTREIIETRDGTVARLVERNGAPITATDDALERDRINAEINDPEAFFKHHRRDRATREDAKQLIQLLPDAMIYSYAAGQPQRPGITEPQVVLDFHPNPAFHPPIMAADILTGIEGRVWIDARSHCMIHVEAHVLRAVNFGFGVVARLYPGGSVAFDQVRAFGDRWAYSHLEEHLTARVLMVKTLPENNTITSSDFRPMPTLMPYQDAIHILLSMPVPLAR